MTRTLALSVNIDHVATLRQARGTTYPDPIEAAAIAESAGARGITVHLRSDRRHIQDHDVRRLREVVRGKLNLEIAATPEMLALASELRPHQVTLVPERPEELTTEGGLDLVARSDEIVRAAERLTAEGIQVSLFLDPDVSQLRALERIGRDRVPGFEINTDAYTAAESAEASQSRLEEIRTVARAGSELGFEVFAGHGLTSSNVVEIAATPQIEELNIGHWLVSRGALIGLADSIREMLAAMREGRERCVS